MNRSRTRTEAGFTYIAVLVMIVIMGIMLGAVGQSWQTVMKREREEELFFRAGQILGVITSLNKGHPVVTQELKNLAKVRVLRTMNSHPPRLRAICLRDPITGKEWTEIKDPARGIIGVASTSNEEPLRKGGFPEEYADFEGKTKYSEWQFVYKPLLPGQKAQRTTTVTGIPLSPVTPPPAGSPGTKQ